MKLPLRIVKQTYLPTLVQIADADHIVVCSLPKSERALAELIVRKINPTTRWWHKLIGPPPDARQRAYNEWVGTRS